MIIIRVELWSAVTGQVTELARMGIDNISGGGNVRSYRCRTWRGRSFDALNKAMLSDSPKAITREGNVENHRSLDLHVWHLVAKALARMGYGQ
jgi:hypothetical protein